MKTLVLASLLLVFSGVVSAQAAPASKTEAVPQLTDAEKVAIRDVQIKYLEVSSKLQNLEKQYKETQAEQADVVKQLNDATAAVQKRLGDGFVIDPETLKVSAKPADTKK